VSAANRPIPNNRFLFFANISSLSRSKTNTQKGEFRYAQKGKHAWKLAAKKSGHGNFIKKKDAQSKATTMSQELKEVIQNRNRNTHQMR